MTNSFHQWVSGKTNCEVFDVSCETDRDCSAACEMLHSEDGREITKFVCNKECGRCNRRVQNSDSLERAAEDLSRIKKRMSSDKTFKAMLPDTFLWFINHDGGNLFVSKRAAYYDIMALAIGSLEDPEGLIKVVERGTAETLRDRLYKKLDLAVSNVTKDEYVKARKWIKDVTEEAGDEGEAKGVGIPFRKLIKQITGGYNLNAARSIKLASEEGEDIPREDEVDLNTDDEDEDLERIIPGFARENNPADDFVLEPVSKSKMRDATLQNMTIDEERSRMRKPREYLCNEEMHAGRAEAVYRDSETGDHIAYCVCQYPEYLVGPTC